MTTDIHIRGKLGMQVFELFAGLPVETTNPFTICVNTGDGSDTSYHNRLGELFDYDLDIIDIGGMDKQKSWTPSAINKIFEKRGRIMSLLKLKENDDYVQMNNILHMRGKDKAVATPSAYLPVANEIAREHTLWILSDDSKYTGAVVLSLQLNQSLDKNIKFNVSQQNDIDDWYSILYAKEIWGCMSTFTLSTLVVNPDKKINLFGELYNDGPYILTEENYQAVETLMTWCPNVTWID
jgi:hypothetical protein